MGACVQNSVVCPVTYAIHALKIGLKLVPDLFWVILTVDARDCILCVVEAHTRPVSNRGMLSVTLNFECTVAYIASCARGLTPHPARGKHAKTTVLCYHKHIIYNSSWAAPYQLRNLLVDVEWVFITGQSVLASGQEPVFDRRKRLVWAVYKYWFSESAAQHGRRLHLERQWSNLFHQRFGYRVPLWMNEDFISGNQGP